MTDTEIILAKDPIIFILVVLFWAASAAFEAYKKKRKKAEPENRSESKPDLELEEAEQIAKDLPYQPVSTGRDAEVTVADLLKHLHPPRPEPVVVPPPVQIVKVKAIETPKILPAPLPFRLAASNLSEAMILKEILDKPVSLRR